MPNSHFEPKIYRSEAFETPIKARLYRRTEIIEVEIVAVIRIAAPGNTFGEPYQSLFLANPKPDQYGQVQQEWHSHWCFLFENEEAAKKAYGY
jgi:hypothetical protein